MRDIRKDSRYFVSYLDYQYSRIEKKTAKLKESSSDEAKKQRILVSMTNYELDLLRAEFSNGALKSDLKELLVKAIDIIKDYKNPTIEDIQTLLSLAIILDAENDAEILIDANKGIISRDRILRCLALYITDKKIEWDNSLNMDDAYRGLEEVFSSSDKEAAMKKYLDGWYKARMGYAWYNSHLSDSDTYCGYWSFESAAIAKMFKLDDDILSESEYYPAI